MLGRSSHFYNDSNDYCYVVLLLCVDRSTIPKTMFRALDPLPKVAVMESLYIIRMQSTISSHCKLRCHQPNIMVVISDDDSISTTILVTHLTTTILVLFMFQ